MNIEMPAVEMSYLVIYKFCYTACRPAHRISESYNNRIIRYYLCYKEEIELSYKYEADYHYHHRPVGISSSSHGTGKAVIYAVDHEEKRYSPDEAYSALNYISVA